MKAIRLLLVDDQAGIRRGLRMRLELEPDLANVGEAVDGAMAVQMVETTQPDVVLMDVEMPGMNGIETAQALHDSKAPCRVVMLSLHDGMAVKAAAREAGAFDFVGKHQPTELLLAALRRAGVRGTGQEDTS
jgi:DNA-binding NarL/FixJ family response regulator